MAVLPKKIVEEILSRLPIKSILRFKIASKNFYSLISNDQVFAKLHLNQSNNILTILFVQGTNAIFKLTSINTRKSSPKIKIPDEIANPRFIVGSANGLICVALTSEKLCFIWNPLTERCKRIAIPTEGCNILGFGYNAVSDDYKIVGKWENEFRVFSLKSNSWTTTKETGFSFEFPKFCAYANGAIHWLIDEKRIAAFDLAREEFLFIKTPVEIVHKPYIWNCPLFHNNGSLCVLDYKSTCGLSVGEMKKYGVAKSWAIKNKVSETDCKRWADHMKVVKGKMYYYDESYEFEIVRFFRYSESLIWPKYLDDFDHPQTQSKRPNNKRKKGDFGSYSNLG